MRQRYAFFSVVFLFTVASASFGATRYATGIQKGGDSIVEILYTPIALNEGRTLEMLVKGEMGEDNLERLNTTPRLGKLGKLVASQDVKIGDTEVAAGEHTCGLNVDKEGKFSFVVWKGEGEEAEAQAASIELYEHDTPAEYLLFSFSPNPEGEGSALWVAYGKYAAAIPVSLGESSKEGKVAYSTGIVMDDKPVVSISYHPTAYAKGETFEKMRKGEMDDHFNDHESFGKVGTFKNSKEVKVGDLPDAPPGEYPCGLNVDGEGNFTFVGWSDEGVYKTPIKLEKHGFAVPHLAMILSPTGEEGSNLRLIYGEYHADVPISAPGSGS